MLVKVGLGKVIVEVMEKKMRIKKGEEEKEIESKGEVDIK